MATYCMTNPPNKLPEPTAVGAVRSAVPVFVTSRRWLNCAWKKSGEDLFDKWRGRGRLPLGRNAEDDLRVIRDGDGR